ncbi:MAG: glycosyltransferase family 39 protein [Deltaproteobacteria bacterium]|nr:glycosyltransferase family 39 protein [Deltaproteobacteria bacterium]
MAFIRSRLFGQWGRSRPPGRLDARADIAEDEPDGIGGNVGATNGKLPQERSESRRAAGAVFVLAAVVILASVPFRPDHVEGDEGFANAGIRALTHFARGEFGHPYWRENDSFYGSPSPRIGPMILGAHDLAARAIGFDAENKRIVFLRVVYGLWSALGVALMFMLARETAGSKTAAWLGAAASLANPVFRSVQVSILPETPMIPLAAAALLFTHRVSRAAMRGGDTRLASAIAGAFIGLAIGCKLYAIPLLVVFALTRILDGDSSAGRRWRDITIASAVAAVVFAAFHPLLWTDPAFALREMTTGHLRALGGELGTLRSDSLAYVATMPFVGVAIHPWPLNQLGGLPLPSGFQLGVVAVCVALTAVGGYRAIRKGSWLLVTFATASFLWAGFVVATLTPGWIVPKVFLLPALGLCALWGVALGAIADRLFPRLRAL